MTPFAITPTLPQPESPRAVRAALLGVSLLVASILLAALVFAPLASAQVREVSGKKVGLQPRSVEAPLDGAQGADFENPNGNPILPETHTYVVYWDPKDIYKSEWQHLVNGFMHNVGADSGATGTVFTVDSQYTDAENQAASYDTAFRGAYTDTHKYPVSPGCTDPHPLEGPAAVTCLTDQQLREELEGYVGEHHLPTGMNTVYYLLTPPGVTVCLDAGATHCSDYTRTKSEETKNEFASVSYANSFCSYHSFFNQGGTGSTILYAAVPWTAGGVGDFYLPAADRTQAYECQDGGYDPSTKPIEHVEEPLPETPEEEVDFEKMTPEEKAAHEEERKHLKRHIEEPEQEGRGEDGAYDAALADLIINQISIEQQDIVTDPLLNAWQGQDPEHLEATDECRNFFASSTGGLDGSSAMEAETFAGSLSNQIFESTSYYLQNSFNRAAIAIQGVPCIAGLNLKARFTAPNTAKVGDVVGFDGMESGITLSAGTRYENGKPVPAYGTFTWKFAAGEEVSGYAPGAPACETPWQSPCAASIYHVFTKPGTYEVSLTVRDAGGNRGMVTHDVTVEPNAEEVAAQEQAPPPPAPTVVTTKPTPPPPAPTLTPTPTVKPEIIHNQNLGDVLSKGLAVHYSPSEPLGGHLEVLMSAALARGLGIKGSNVGVSGEVEVGGKALSTVVTSTKSVHGWTTHIMLGKQALQALKKHKGAKLTFEIRAVLFNAASRTGIEMSAPRTIAPANQKRAHASELALH